MSSPHLWLLLAVRMSAAVVPRKSKADYDGRGAPRSL